MQGKQVSKVYKILIKYRSTFNKTFWRFYMVEQEDGNLIEYSSQDTDEIRYELKKLDMVYGFENLRLIMDVNSDLNINVGDPQVDIATTEDIDDMYRTAFEKIFSEVRNEN